MAVRNHDEETKGCIWLETTDGTQQEVEDDVAMLCPFICRETLHQGKGSSTITPVVLPPQVTPSILGLILEYCSFHQVPGRSNKERKSFNERFIRLDTKRLCELTSAADSLQMKPLVDLTSRALARMIEGKTPEEIRETFHLPDDLTEEEKLEPLKNTTDDPRIRLLNRLYARKRKELQEKDKSKSIQNENCHNDERSVEDLVSFINGESEDSKSAKAGKCKKKRNRRKKDQAKDETMEPSSSNGGGGLHIDARGKEVQNNLMFRQMRTPSNVALHLLSLASGSEELAFEADFDDGDLDDGLDPVMKEKLDREVEDFARRLNSDWPERRRAQDIASGK